MTETAIRFEAESHTYWQGADRLPSVTQVLGDAGYYDGLQFVDPDLLERKSRIGSKVHEMVHRFHQGHGALWHSDPEVMGYLRSYSRCLELLPLEVVHTEVVVWSSLGYAGTVDQIARFAGEWGIGDIKCTAKLNKPALCLQSAAYARAVEERFGYRITRRWGLHLRVDGGLPRPRHCEGDIDFDLFRRALARYKVMNG